MRQVDTIADPGSRVVQDYTFTGASAANIDGLILLLQAMCLAQGWTTEASTTTSGHPDRTMRTRQSPWWDDTVSPPSTYKGYARVRFFATSNTTLRVRVSNFDGSVTQTSGDTTIIGAAGLNLRIHVCGFQLFIFTPGVNSYDLVVSALHSPRWYQEAGLVELIYHSRTSGAGGFRTALYDVTPNMAFIHVNDALGARTLDTVTSMGANNVPRLEAMRGYAGGTLRIANPIDDVTLTDATKWFPWFLPAAIALPNGPLFTDTLGITYHGFFWDMIVATADPASLQQTQQFDNGIIVEAVTFNNSAGSTALGTLYLRTS